MYFNVLFQIVIMLFIFACEVFSKCPNGIIAYKVSTKEENAIVKKHNDLRLLISQGKIPKQPKGVDLKRMKWDKALGKKAQEIANTCVFEHVKVSNPKFPAVGQNLYISMSTGQDKSGSNWNSAVQAWFDEHKLYTYPSGSNSATGHYTQVVWANSQYIGCGYSYYPEGKWYKKLYVCNYGPAGNYIGQTPYKTSGGNCSNLC